MNIPKTLLLMCPVLAVAYRLGPEHPFPSALCDTQQAYHWLQQQVPAHRIAVVGDSAGRSLAAAQPCISPLNADLRGLPPLLVQAGTEELILEDTRRFVQHAVTAGVRVVYEEWPMMFHVWHMMAGYLPEGRQALDHVRQFLCEECALCNEELPGGTLK